MLYLIADFICFGLIGKMSLEVIMEKFKCSELFPVILLLSLNINYFVFNHVGFGEIILRNAHAYNNPC